MEHGADLNFAPAVDGRHPLVAAAGNGDVDMVRWLTERGARLESVSSGGQTPLIAAVASGWEKVAEFLLEEGVDPAYNSPTGRTALRAAVIYGRDAKLEDEQVAAMRMVRRFVELKCDVNSIDADGKSLLDHAVLAHFSELPEYLKSKGAKTAKALLKK